MIVGGTWGNTGIGIVNSIEQIMLRGLGREMKLKERSRGVVTGEIIG